MTTSNELRRDFTNKGGKRGNPNRISTESGSISTRSIDCYNQDTSLIIIAVPIANEAARLLWNL